MDHGSDGWGVSGIHSWKSHERVGETGEVLAAAGGDDGELVSDSWEHDRWTASPWMVPSTRRLLQRYTSGIAHMGTNKALDSGRGVKHKTV